VRPREIRHLVPTTCGTAPKEPHQRTGRQHCPDDDRRPHQHLSQPHSSLNFHDAMLGVPESRQGIHALLNARDRSPGNR